VAGVVTGVATEVVVVVNAVDEQPHKMRPRINKNARTENRIFFILITSFY
jgi:hypothetical protein